MHDYLAADRPAAEFADWLLADTLAQAGRIHDALRLRAATDRVARLRADLRIIDRLKDIGRFDSACELIARILPAATQGSERSDLLLQLAECHRRAYRWSQAGAALAEAEAAADGEQATTVALAVQRAALLLARGLPDLAIADVEAAERAASDPWSAAQALFVRLRLEHALRRPARAVALLRSFLAQQASADLATDPDWQRKVVQLRIRAALAVLIDPSDRLGDDAELEASSWLQAAVEDPATPNDERLLARIVWVTWRLDRGCVAGVDAALTAAIRELPLGSAAELEERRLALATLAVRHARLAGLPPGELLAHVQHLRVLWHQLVARWHDQPASRVGEGPLFFGDCRRAFLELLRADLALGSDAAAVFGEVVRATAPGSLSKQLGAAAPTLEAVRASLCVAGGGVLVFVPGHDASLALAIDAVDVTTHLLAAGAFAIDDARQRLLLELDGARQGEPSTSLHEAARRCAELLLPENVIERMRDWRLVTIVGTETLGYLPFELLQLPSGVPFGLSHAIAYQPSLAVGVWLSNHRPPMAAAARRPSVRLVACPDAVAPAQTSEQPPPLPFGAEELRAIEEACSSTSLQALHGTAATHAAAFAVTEPVDLLHVIAHGVRDERRSDPQGILFADGHVVFGQDIEQGTSPPWVLLNVCRAGRGRLRRGDDGRHLLSGAVLLAGARGVVLPVTDVSYRATLAFAADLHVRLWQDRLALGEAMRSARLAAAQRGERELIEASLFHLVGLGDQPLASPLAQAAPRTAWSALLVVGALVVGTGVVWHLRLWRQVRIVTAAARR